MEDRTPFDAIKDQFGLKQEVIELMRKEMKRSSFNLWRARVQGRKTKHRKARGPMWTDLSVQDSATLATIKSLNDKIRILWESHKG